MQVKNNSTFSLFQELLQTKTPAEIAELLNLHTGTIKRWLQKKEVPKNYYNELNLFLGNKYELNDSFRSKDQFFTSKEIANYCYSKTIEICSNLVSDISEYKFIEPSAGCCNFYDLLPKNKRIGVDIEPKGNNAAELIKCDYLSYVPPANDKYIVIGNPPFGLRGNLALRFINHSSKFADFVSFVLPPLFNSTGKGVPMTRVKGYKLIHTEKLPLDSFYYPNGETVSISTIFQIWSKFGDEDLSKKKKKDVSNYIKIYSLSNGDSPSSKRNIKMLNACDIYLPSTCFNGMKAYDSFDELPNNRGYGIVVYKDRKKIIKSIKNINWHEVAFLSTNSALNLRTDIIIDELIKRNIIMENNNEQL